MSLKDTFKQDNYKTMLESYQLYVIVVARTGFSMMQTSAKNTLQKSFFLMLSHVQNLGSLTTQQQPPSGHPQR